MKMNGCQAQQDLMSYSSENDRLKTNLFAPARDSTVNLLLHVGQKLEVRHRARRCY